MSEVETGQASGQVREQAGEYVTSSGHTVAHVAGRNGGTLMPFDSTRAAAASRARWEKVGAAARRGMAKAAANLPDVNRNSPIAVVEYIVEQHTMNAADPSAPGSSNSFKQVMSLAYPKPERSVEEVATTAAAQELGTQMARELLAYLREQGVGKGE